MTDKKVWFITGAGRGMGVDIAKAAVAAGNAVVATARSTDTIGAALGQNEDLLAVKLDVTDPANAEVSVRAAMSRFGRIDVLVNNASSSRGRSRVRGLIPTARAWRRERRSPRTSASRVGASRSDPTPLSSTVTMPINRRLPSAPDRSGRRAGPGDCLTDTHRTATIGFVQACCLRPFDALAA